MSLLFKFRPLVINPELAAKIGLNETIVLQQLHYWLSETGSGVEHDGATWVYNTHQQWQEQFPFWSVDTVKRAFSSLSSKGLIRVEQLNKSRHDRTNFYTVDYRQVALIESGEVAPFEKGKLHSSKNANTADLLSEITTETTTEKNTVAGATAPKRPPRVDPEFEAAWKLYPKREGSNPKNKAQSAWNARKREGVSAEDMMQGLIRYSAYCAARGITGTEYVMQAQRFFGNGREFDNGWSVSTPPSGCASRGPNFDDTSWADDLGDL